MKAPIPLLFTLLLGATIASGTALGFDLKVPARGTIKGLSTQTTQTLEPNSTTSITTDEPRLVQLENRIPVLVVSARSGDDVVLDPPKSQDVFSENVQSEASRLLSPLLASVLQIQEQIQSKNFKQAQESLAALQLAYPRVAFLEFIRGSLLAVSGNRPEAIRAIELGLQSHPEYAEGKTFLRKLKGGS